MTARLVPDLSMSEYRADPSWGSSDLKAMRLGPPARVPWERENPRPETDATRLGTGGHSRIIQPDLFVATYCTKPEGLSFATREGKAWRDDPVRAGRIILPNGDGTAIDGIYTAFTEKTIAAESLARATHREASIFWECPNTGEALKGRPDWFDDDAVYDLKVSRHAGPSLQFRAYAEGWLHQLSHYREGLYAWDGKRRHGRLVVIAPKAPHYTWCVEAKDAALDVVGLENEAAVKRLREHRESGRWPGTPDGWERIDLPPAALAQIVNLADAEEV